MRYPLMIASTAPSARFAASSASRNAPRLSRSRALVRSAIGPSRAIPMFAAPVNFSWDVSITPTTAWNWACWIALKPCLPCRARYRSVQVNRDRLEGFDREIESALEIVVLHRGPRSGEEVLDRSDVPAQVLGRQDQRLRLRERGRQVLLEHLLAPLPRLLREVDRGAEVLGREGAFRLRERRLGLRELPADAFRESAERRTRVDDRARPLAVNALAPFECFARLVHGDLVVLRGHRLVRLGEGLLRVDDVRVRPAGPVHQVLPRLDAVFGGLTSPPRLFDLFLQLAAQLAVPQGPAPGSTAPLAPGTASALHRGFPSYDSD